MCSCVIMQKDSYFSHSTTQCHLEKKSSCVQVEEKYRHRREEEEHNKDLHMSRLVSHNKGRGEAVFVVEGAAADWVTHPCDRSVTWRTPGKRIHVMRKIKSYWLLFNKSNCPNVEMWWFFMFVLFLPCSLIKKFLIKMMIHEIMSSATKQETDITNIARWGCTVGDSERVSMFVSFMIIIYDWNSYFYRTAVSCCTLFATCCISRCEHIVNVNNRVWLLQLAALTNLNSAKIRINTCSLI